MFWSRLTHKNVQLKTEEPTWPDRTWNFFLCHKLSWHNSSVTNSLEISNMSIRTNLYVHVCDSAEIVGKFLHTRIVASIPAARTATLLGEILTMDCPTLRPADWDENAAQELSWAPEKAPIAITAFISSQFFFSNSRRPTQNQLRNWGTGVKNGVRRFSFERLGKWKTECGGEERTGGEELGFGVRRQGG